MKNFKTIYPKILSIEPIRRQSLITFGLQIIFTAVGFLSTMYFAHTVGAPILGSYFLFLAYFSIICLFTDGGFGQAAIKRISEGIDQNEYFSTFVFLRTFFVTIVIITLFLFQSYFNSELFYWLIIALIVSLLTFSVSSGINGCSKIGVASTGNFINNVSRIIIQVIAVYFGYNTVGLIGGFIAGMLIGFLLEFYFLNLKITTFKWKHIKSLSSFSIWMFLISGGWIIFLNIDTIMIGYYLSTTEVGIYRIVFQFTSVAAFVTTALRTVLLPRISRWNITGDTKLIEESLSHAITFSLLIGIPLFVGGILLGDKILYYFFGASFESGYIALILLFIVQIINIFHYLFITYLTGLDKVKQMLIITLALVLCNVVLNAFLIPMIGINGAAIATLLTMLIHALLMKQILSKLIEIKLERTSIINIFHASVTMGIVVWCYRMLIPLTSVYALLFIITISGLIYIKLILDDEMIKSETNKILTQIGVRNDG